MNFGSSRYRYGISFCRYTLWYDTFLLKALQVLTLQEKWPPICLSFGILLGNYTGSFFILRMPVVSEHTMATPSRSSAQELTSWEETGKSLGSLFWWLYKTTSFVKLFWWYFQFPLVGSEPYFAPCVPQYNISLATRNWHRRFPFPFHQSQVRTS